MQCPFQNRYKKVSIFFEICYNELGDRMSKKNKQVILKNNQSVESDESKKLIKIIIIVAIIFLLFYIATLFFTKKDKDNIFKNDLNAAEIQYDEIIIGEMFNKQGEYYVLLQEEDDPYKSILNTYVTSIRSGKNKVAI